MKKVGIVVDNYKLKVFRKNLKNAGFEWSEEKFNKDTTSLLVVCENKDFHALAAVTKQSNDQARQGKKK